MNDFSTMIAQLRAQIDEKLVNSIPEIAPHSLYEPIRYFIGIGGKRLRPILLLLSAQAVGGSIDGAMNAAVAIELLHNFTLVHDDIMDHDHLRRGHTTVHVKWDESVAILAGDGLIGLAYRQLMKLPSQYFTDVCKLFTEGVIEVCEGQAFDKEFEDRDDVDMEEYYRMIGKKTGQLITMSTQIGAILGGGNEEEINLLRDYGAVIGTAFQIQDDMLDIISSEDVIGKTFGSDLVAGKKTFLMIKALNLIETKKRDRILTLMQSPEITKDHLLEIGQIFKDTRIIKQAEEVIVTAFNKANSVLSRFPRPDSAINLRNFSTMLLNRKY